MTSSLLTPDFNSYPSRKVENLTVHPLGLEVTYDDNQKTFHLSSDLRIHAIDDETIHQITREPLISPLDVPDDLSIKSAKILNDGTISITWSHPVTANDSGVSIFQPSWLYQTGLFGGIYHENDLEIETWEAKEFNNIISIDGNDYLGNKESFKKMLQTIIKFGVVVIKGLPVKESMLEEVVSKIGTIRSSNFGKIFDVKFKNDPDSNAYTGEELLVHNDLSTREYVPGLQFLYCIENDTNGGLSTLTDAFAVAKYIKNKSIETYNLLSEYPMSFANKSASSDYRIDLPIFNHDNKGKLSEVRWTCWLRSPLRGELSYMKKVNDAQKYFYKLANDSRFKIEFKMNPGDMMCMDNRRILHGRTSFLQNSGSRWLRGCYMERDELWSAYRVSERS